MSNSSIFSLDQVYKKQVLGEWQNEYSVWNRTLTDYPAPSVQGTPYGYVRQQKGPGSNQKIYRIDYSSDSTTLSSINSSSMPSSASSRSAAGLTTRSYGYWTMGGDPVSENKIYKFDYANDTSSMTAPGAEVTPREMSSGVGNDDYGYIVGGGPSGVTSVLRFDFSSDTSNTSPKGPLDQVARISATAGNTNYGYIAGVWGSGSRIQRIDYSNDTATASIPGATTNPGGTTGHSAGSDNNYMWMAGGNSTSGHSRISRLDFSNDTANCVQAANTVYTRSWSTSVTNDTVGMYWGGGYGTGTNNLERYDFSNDTVNAVSCASWPGGFGANWVQEYCPQGLSSRQGGMAKGPITSTTTRWVDSGVIGNSNIGYSAGGDNSPSLSNPSNIDRIDFSNDTATLAIAYLDGGGNGNNQFFASASSGTHGYWFGGDPNPGNTMSSIERLDYSNDTTNLSSIANFSNPSSDQAATSSPAYAYIMGGYGPVSTVNRLDFGNDTATPVAKGPLPYKTHLMPAATGTPAYGYMSGGYAPSAPYWPGSGNISSTSRIDYDNDTNAAAPKGPLVEGVAWTSASGNADYGYWFGGGNAHSNNPSKSYTQRLDFSNDTATALYRGNFPGTRSENTSTGNASHGYNIGGGLNATGDNISNCSTVFKIDYSNDTSTFSSAMNQRVASYQSAICIGEDGKVVPTPADIPYGSEFHPNPTPQYNYGYWFGGKADAGDKSTIERIDFDNDTATAAIKGRLHNHNSRNTVCFGNKSYAFNVGRYPNNYSTVTRLDYSNDGVSTAGGNIGYNRFDGAGGTGSNNYGYVGGGDITTPRTHIFRYDYSNYGSNASPRSNLETSVRRMTAGGTPDYGYWVGGSTAAPGNPADSGIVSILQRLDYSNDTTTTSPKGPLRYNSYFCPITGTSNFGLIWNATNYPSSPLNTTYLDYANDTALPVIKASVSQYLSNEGDGMGGTCGNNDYAWVNAASSKSNVYRFDYSNDTTTPPARGYLTSDRTAVDAASGIENGLS